LFSGLLAKLTAAVLARVTAAQQAAQLSEAVTSGRRIGAAVGIIAARRHLTLDQALDLLVAASQAGNRKLRDLAEDVIRDGDL
jgi:AmiR/NasT family two-component response regulator